MKSTKSRSRARTLAPQANKEALAAPPRRPRGRPRSEMCHHAIISATIELLDTQRYPDVTMDGIAERAEVSKQTLYKWWGSKSKLAMEAMAVSAARQMPMPDTGSVEADFVELLIYSFRWLTRANEGSTCAGLIAEMQYDPELADAFRNTYIAARRGVGKQLLERGIARGEVRADIDIQLALDFLYGPVWYRMLLRHAPLDLKYARALVSHWLVALRTAKAPRPSISKLVQAR